MTIRHLLVAGAAIAALSVSACAPVSSAVTPVAEGKAVVTVDAAFDTATLGVETALRAGALKGQNIATARALLAKANTARKAAEDAYKAGNSASVSAQISALNDLIVQIAELTGAAPVKATAAAAN